MAVCHLFLFPCVKQHTIVMPAKAGIHLHYRSGFPSVREWHDQKFLKGAIGIHINKTVSCQFYQMLDIKSGLTYTILNNLLGQQTNKEEDKCQPEKRPITPTFAN